MSKNFWIFSKISRLRIESGILGIWEDIYKWVGFGSLERGFVIKESRFNIITEER